MQKVERWETSDGKLFEDVDEANAHEQYVKLNEAVTGIVANFYYRDISEDGIIRGIMENLSALRKILK